LVHPYFKITLAAFAIVDEFAEVLALAKLSSLPAMFPFVVKAINITTNTGTNKSRKGDTFVNFFIILRF